MEKFKLLQILIPIFCIISIIGIIATANSNPSRPSSENVKIYTLPSNTTTDSLTSFKGHHEVRKY